MFSFIGKVAVMRAVAKVAAPFIVAGAEELSKALKEKGHDTSKLDETITEAKSKLKDK